MNNLKKKDFYQRLIKLAMPIVFQQLMLALVAVGDALMLGNIDQNTMAGVSLATQIQFVQNIMITAMLSGAMVLAAQYWGKKDRRSFLDIYNIALRLTAIVSLTFFALCEFCPVGLMKIFTNEQELMLAGAGYLRIAGWSYLIVGTSQTLHSLLKVSEHVKTAAGISISTVILNIFFNAILIYGLFGLPRMEERGAALATVSVRILEFFVLIIFLSRKDYIAPDLSRIFVHVKVLFNDYLRCMLPLLGAGLIWGIGFTSYTSFMGHLGKDAAAANSICAVVRDCLCSVADGLALGASILVGNELGKGDLKLGKTYGIRMAKISFIAGGLCTVIMLALMFPVAYSVKLTDGARHLFFGMMMVMSVYMIGRMVNTVIINGIFAAGGDTMFDLYSLIVTMWCLAIPLAAAGTFFFSWHPIIVYACTCLDEVGKIPWVIVHFRKYHWVKDLTREASEL